MTLAHDALPIGTKVRINSTFDRNGEVGMQTVAPDFHAVIVGHGDLEDSYTGHQSYVIELTGLIPPEFSSKRWWADATQFEVID